MTEWVALLRAINVGANRSFPMADVKKALAAVGATDVTTYVQSGNAVFRHAANSEKELVAMLEKAFTKAAGFEIPTIVRTRAQWKKVVKACPYDDEPTKVHAVFLAEKPARDAFDKLDLTKFEPEQLAVVGRDLFLHLPNGMGKSKLAVAITRTKTGAAGTARNWRTVLALDALLK